MYVCNKPGAPTGSGGGSGGKKKPTYSAIAVSVASLNDGDLEFGGAYSAGYAKRKKAVRSARRACRRAYEGRCRKVASARNGWAVIVAVLDDQERIRVFGGSDTGRESAFQEAERRTRDAFGGTSPYPIQRVRAVRSKTARRR